MRLNHNYFVRNVQSKHLQCDEIWNFCYAKAKNAPEDKKALGSGVLEQDKMLRLETTTPIGTAPNDMLARKTMNWSSVRWVVPRPAKARVQEPSLHRSWLPG